MSEWRERRISELGDLFDGPHATPTRATAGKYFLNISSLKNGRLDLAESDHVSDEDFERWTRRVVPEAGDILFSYETRLGEAAIMPSGVEACLGRRMALLRPNRAIIDPNFLLYLYLSPAFQGLIRRHTIHGATVNRIGLSTMGDWRVSIPPIRTQRAIAEVLGAFDDKTAANSRKAQISRQLADTLYDRAVVGQESVRMSDVVIPILGGTPSRERADYWRGSNPWISARDVTAAPAGVILNTIESISDRATSETKAKPLRAGSVVLTARGTVGAVARLGIASSFNQSCYGFEPGALPPGVLYFTILRASKQLRSMAHGSVFDTITMGTFEHLSTPKLDSFDLARLEASLSPLLEVIKNTMEENDKLAVLRDTLLPQLMSGNLRVRDAEKMIDEVH